MIKAVITADVHIHNFKICSRDNGADRLRDGLSVLRQSLDLARKSEAVWIMAGDFKQPKTQWPQEALTGSHEILREYGDVKKYMIAGNHDALGLGGSGLSPFKDCATVIEWEAEEHDGILFVPFGADLTAVKTNKHLPIVTHAFIRGAFIGPEDIRLPGVGVDLADYGQFPVMFAGDIHKGQWRQPADPASGRAARWIAYENAGALRAPGSWKGEVFYPGSTYMQNWGERNDAVKGALLVNFKTGSVSVHEFDAPRFVQIELQDKATPVGKSSDFVRIITDDAKLTQQALEANGLTFRSVQIIERPRAETRETRSNIHAGMDKNEMLESYMKARPAPSGVDPEQAFVALSRLWGGE
jgi:hypothetical protein